MKKLLILFAIFTTVAATAQSVGINADGSTANTSAMLDVSSTTKGFLPPRMTTVQRDAIVSAATGLVLFNTTTNGLEYKSSTGWVTGGIPAGSVAGEMLYWNGTAWVSVAPTNSLPGNQAKALKFCNGVPTWEDCPALLPTLSTSTISDITSSTASSGGEVSNDGGANVSTRGICWSTSSNPTIALSTKTTDSSGTGSFISSMTGLSTVTQYYVRAYATNSAGTAYGNELSFTTLLTLSIGVTYQGGKIAYILQPTDPGCIAGQTHGLIAAASNQSTGAEWGCYGTLIPGADETALGTGNQNTIDIMVGCTTNGIAAKLCGDLVLGGYSDWYLPSRDELDKLYINQGAVGGFSSGDYWSSSEGGSLSAWSQSFYDGFQFSNVKNFPSYVRAVRSF